MYVIQGGLQPEENSIWNVENLAGLPPIILMLHVIQGGLQPEINSIRNVEYLAGLQPFSCKTENLKKTWATTQYIFF